MGAITNYVRTIGKLGLSEQTKVNYLDTEFER